VADFLSSWTAYVLAVIYIFLEEFCGQPLIISVVVSGQIFVEDNWVVVTVCHQYLFTPME
jgi:hypothetical protein